MLDTEFKFFLAHKDELVEKYLGKHIAIKGTDIFGVYENEAEAYVDIVNKNELGNVLIQYCSPLEESYVQRFHSRVIF